MYQFEAAVTHLRKGWRLFIYGLPLCGIWYYFYGQSFVWSWLDRVYLIWIVKHKMTFDYLNQHIALGLLFALGFTILSALIVFLGWVALTINQDLEFTKSSVAVLAIACMLIGSCGFTFFYLSIHWLIPFSMGASLLALETGRMRVLAMTY